MRVGAPAERDDSAGQPPSQFLSATGRSSSSDGRSARQGPQAHVGGLGRADVAAEIDGSASFRCFRWLGEFYPAVDSADFAAGDQGFHWVSTSKSARKSPAKATAGSSRRAPCNSVASPESTSIVAPAPSITGSTRSQRASALNARAINNLELQALEASDTEVLGWSSGAANSAARATSASSPLVVDSPSPPVVTPTPAPKSVVESDESSDSVAEALEEKPASPLTPASVSPTPSTDQKRPSSPVAPASTKKARANASAKSSSSPRPVTKSASRVHPTAKSSKAAKSATKTARGTAKSGKSAKSADPPTPPSGQSASASGTAAVSAPTSSASSGQASNLAGGATSLPDVLRLPILTLRTRAAQAVSGDPRVPAQMKIWRDPPFFHLGSARCWDQVMGSCVVEIQKEIVDGKPRVRSTPSSLSGLAAFADVYAAQHLSQRLRALFPDGPFFTSVDVLRRVRARRSSPKSAPLVEIVAECWLKCRGDRQEMAKVFVALYERMHSLVDSSVVLGLHPDLNPTSSADELALAYQLWQKYSHERKRRSDALRSVLTELYGTLYKAVTEFDATSNTPAPQLDSELYFDPSVPFAPPANLPWFPTSADWCEAAVDVDVGEPW
ncbi:unnamed protein product [Phytophthora fragariaefolia]|uniref:Unnamed protein product n=1 Tax=Phytophthora fragariaefolia TaxID=1490495 RepID=A0A9W6XHL0_9STRA|nr:unnamed protein product [Phytophthora fragariaefolia]